MKKVSLEETQHVALVDSETSQEKIELAAEFGVLTFDTTDMTDDEIDTLKKALKDLYCVNVSII